VSCLTAAYMASNALPQLRGLIPGDSPSFYFGARMVVEGEVSRLYDPWAIDEQWQGLRGEQVYREAAKHDNYFLRPAFAALLLAPFGWLSFYQFWPLFGFLSVAGALLIAWKFPTWFGRLAEQRDWAPWTVAYFPFVFAIGEGQDTIILTLCLGASLALILSGRQVAGGGLAALLLVKPHLAWGLPLALLAIGKRRAVVAFAGVGGVLLIGSAALVGVDGLRQWAALLDSPRTDLVPQAMFNLRALAFEAGDHVAFLVAATVGVSAIAVLLRGATADRLAVGVLAPLLFSPHTYAQDLALCAVLPYLTKSKVVTWAVLAPWLYLMPPGRGGNWVFLALASAYLGQRAFEIVRPSALTSITAPAAGSNSITLQGGTD